MADQLYPYNRLKSVKNILKLLVLNFNMALDTVLLHLHSFFISS